MQLYESLAPIKIPRTWKTARSVPSHKRGKPPLVISSSAHLGGMGKCGNGQGVIYGNW